eukprot:1156371-Pelagomonas_calceolata.AAC.1
MQRIKQAYAGDSWIQANKAKFRRHQGLYLMAEKIVVPDDNGLRAQIIQMHHAPLYAGHRATAFAVNNSKSESPGESPAFLMQGQHPLTPVTIQIDSTVPAARLFAAQLQQTNIKVQHSFRKLQERQKAQAYTHRRDVKYAVGDQVLLSTRNLTLQGKGPGNSCPNLLGHSLSRTS